MTVVIHHGLEGDSITSSSLYDAGKDPLDHFNRNTQLVRLKLGDIAFLRVIDPFDKDNDPPIYACLEFPNSVDLFCHGGLSFYATLLNKRDNKEKTVIWSHQTDIEFLSLEEALEAVNQTMDQGFHPYQVRCREFVRQLFEDVGKIRPNTSRSDMRSEVGPTIGARVLHVQLA